MDALRICVLFLIFKILDEADGNCVLSLNKDFSSPSPVFLKNGELLSPSSKGDIAFRRSEVVTVACVGDRRHVVLGNDSFHGDVVEASCISNVTFRVGNWEGLFKDIKCNTQPLYTTVDTKKRCFHKHKLYRVGFEVRGKLYSIYEACFDEDQLNTLYVKHELSPASKFLQTGSRPQFTEGTLFGKVRMSQLYKIKNQRDRLNSILGDGMDQKYLSKKQFLTRGHLAPRADFPLRGVQRASFHYVNTAPQWMRGNAGDWAALEDALRRRIHGYGNTVVVYTGTHGVSTLEDKNGGVREIYLHADANNNFIVPVPMYFYKVIYDPKKKSAVAFVSVNSSFYNTTMTDRLTFCEDICEQITWVKWRSSDGTHSFCCSYAEFAGAISELPPLKVNSLFL